MSSLAALLQTAGVPWYESMLEESELTTPAAVRAGGAEALAAAGVEPQHALAIMQALKAEQAAVAVPAAASAAAGSGAACAAFTRGGLYSADFLQAVAPLYEQVMGGACPRERLSQLACAC